MSRFFKEKLSRRFLSEKDRGARESKQLVAQYQVRKDGGLWFVIDQINGYEYCRTGSGPETWHFVIGPGNPTGESFQVDRETGRFFNSLVRDAS